MKVAVLGPKGTYSEIAAIKYCNEKLFDYELGYFNTIDDAVFSLDNGYDLAVVPVENTLDGYVQKTLDLLLEENIIVIDQLRLPISFKLVLNCKLENIDKVYAQFKAIGQCSKFVNSLNNVKIVNTESNVLSYYSWLDNDINAGAIIPEHLESTSNYVCNNITDIENNYTRFFILSKDNRVESKEGMMRIPLYIIPLTEHPGLLYQILKVFYEYNINLTSILSRPKKSVMGEYNFYLEIEATNQQLVEILNHIDNSNKNFTIKILGKLEEINNG